MGNLKAHVSLLSANIIYGFNYVFAKDIMPGHFEPRAIILFRASGALVAFWLMHRFVSGEKIADKDIPRFILCALFGLAINQIFFFEGLNLTTAVNSSIIMTINPLLVLVFSRVIIGDRITWMKTFGIICGASGAVFLILNKGSISFASGTFVGNTFTFINATSFALYLVLVKPLMMKYSPLTVMKWIFAFGFIIVFPLCIGKVIRTDYASIPVSAWFSLSYIVIAATILGYLLYNYSLRFLSPASTSSYIYLQPLLASLTSFFLGRETITWLDAGCALLIFTGVFLVSYRSSRRKVFS